MPFGGDNMEGRFPIPQRHNPVLPGPHRCPAHDHFGRRAPAHAAYLTAYSSVFSGVLEAHCSSRSHINCPARIPLPDCSLQEAEIFLCYLYRTRADAQLTPTSARAIVKLAHKFDVKVALEQCDEFLAKEAAINIRTNILWVSHFFACTAQTVAV